MERHDAQEGAAIGGLKAHFLNERPMLLRLLRARLGNADDAEEVLQDVWLRLDRAASGPIAEPGAYLFRIANNIALDRRRSALARLQRESDWHDIHGPSVQLPSAEWVMIQSQRLARVDAMLSALPDRTARIFRDYRYDGIPRKAIAETLGISVSAVEKHLQKAYRALHDVDGDENEQAGAAREAKAMTDDR
jgi:RNA polymerase sigma-70 factor (ECF subfamily)